MQAIVNIERLNRFINEYRAEHKAQSIVFTNGCFDILHRGHVQYLEMAKAKGDLLVVGLNSDESVRRLKGLERPYIKAEDRAYILSRLEAVDVVSVFEEDTPLKIIENVQPDVLVKGSDYEIDEIVGRDVVVHRGGQVITIPLVKGRSTSAILQKIKLNK
ncbi:MAG: D-glycero-beta-D-manno-heptose 1-phosphate adenylyltransferase [Caldithrix sp.]|nr:D-glycero-beta-D-manno-heptose 1-phosphate adenylyltransferase [Caldithrix sp.]